MACDNNHIKQLFLFPDIAASDLGPKTVQPDNFS